MREFPTVQQKEHLLVERPHSIAENRDSGEQCFDLPNVGRVHLFVEGKLSLESATRLLPFWSFGSRFSLGHSLKQVAEWNSNTPNGIRIRVGGVKGRCPRPLDDGGTRNSISELCLSHNLNCGNPQVHPAGYSGLT